MHQDSQIHVPDSFIALYLLHGHGKPTASREVIASRYELCEDLSSQLHEYARTTHFDLGLAEDEVLSRCHRGLLDPAAGVSPDEAAWVVRRLAELLGWDDPPLGDGAAAAVESRDERVRRRPE